jgi:hypothetical protein
VRRTISLIDNRLTKYKRRISAHCSTPTTTSPSLEHNRARLPTIPDGTTGATEGSAFNRRQGVSIEPASISAPDTCGIVGIRRPTYNSVGREGARAADRHSPWNNQRRAPPTWQSCSYPLGLGSSGDLLCRGRTLSMGLAYDPGPSASRTARRCIRRVAGRAAEACLTHNFVGVHSGTLAQVSDRSVRPTAAAASSWPAVCQIVGSSREWKPTGSYNGHPAGYQRNAPSVCDVPRCVERGREHGASGAATTPRTSEPRSRADRGRNPRATRRSGPTRVRARVGVRGGVVRACYVGFA